MLIFLHAVRDSVVKSWKRLSVASVKAVLANFRPLVRRKIDKVIVQLPIQLTNQSIGRAIVFMCVVVRASVHVCGCVCIYVCASVCAYAGM